MKGEMLLKLSQSFGTVTGTIGSHFDLSCASLHALAAQNQRRQLIQFPAIFLINLKPLHSQTRCYNPLGFHSVLRNASADTVHTDFAGLSNAESNVLKITQTFPDYFRRNNLAKTPENRPGRTGVLKNENIKVLQMIK